MLRNNLFYEINRYHKKFSDLCEPLKQYLGINNVAFFNVNKDGTAIYLHSNLAWLEGYIKREHYKADPHMVHPDNINGGFSIFMLRDEYQYEPYTDILLYKNFNKLTCGFTYVKKTKFGFIAFCFASDAGNHEIINIPINEEKIIKNLIQKLHNQILISFPDLRENKIQLDTLKGSQFFQQQGIVFRKGERKL